MKEIRSPKKPLIYYYGIILLVLILFNAFIVPMFIHPQVMEVDYGTFMRMIEEENIGLVQIED